MARKEPVRKRPQRAKPPPMNLLYTIPWGVGYDEGEQYAATVARLPAGMDLDEITSGMMFRLLKAHRDGRLKFPGKRDTDILDFTNGFAEGFLEALFRELGVEKPNFRWGEKAREWMIKRAKEEWAP